MRRNRNCLLEDFDSSPNTARYLAFKAATFKSRNSSIARTTVGSMDTILSLAVTAPWTLCLAGKGSRGRRLVARKREEHDRPGFARSPPQDSEQLMSTGRCPDLPPSRFPPLLDRDHFCQFL